MKRVFKFFIGFCLLVSVCSSYAATRRTGGNTATQKVINVGTKVENARDFSTKCREQYNACMDLGCMIENQSGGRCRCSDQIKELDEIFAKIKQKNFETQKIIFNGVDFVNMDEARDSVMSRVAEVIDEDEEDDWDIEVPTDVVGDSLRAKMHKICLDNMPEECDSQIALVKNLYVQNVKSDCAAYENALNTQKYETMSKRAEAKKSVRDAALAQYQDANKYNLSQCVNEFSKCLQTTGGCGSDFSGCATLSASDNIKSTKNGGIAKQTVIRGEYSSITIAASTMDTLLAKKTLCEDVTKNCENVKDQVWDTFLTTNIPTIKMAELNAESNVRSSCLTNISNCFLKACKDTISGEESYDLCLSHPETVKSLCKVELEPCLAATGGSYERPDSSTLWASVLAKLAAMRVDACTAEVKECLKSEDRCGEDYSQCVGLDTNIIIRMCPYDKLVGCQKVYGDTKIQGEEVYDDVARIVEGLILNIDNDMLKTCEAAVDKAMISVCGDADSCDSYAIGDNLGAQSLKYQVCQYSTKSAETTEGFKWFDCRDSIDFISDAELGRVKNSASEGLGVVKPFAGVISGVIKWESVELTDDGFIDVAAYMDALKNEDITDEEKLRVQAEIEQLQGDINNVIASVEMDNIVQFCTTGRKIAGITDQFGSNTPRFPKLANTVRKQIAAAALAKAKANYYEKYDELTERMQEDLVKINERVAENAEKNGEDAKTAAAREACVNMAAISAFAKAPVGQSLWAKILVGIIVIAAIVVATIFTCGAAGVAVGAITGVVEAAAAATELAAFGAGLSVAATTVAVNAAVAGIGVAGAAVAAAGTAQLITDAASSGDRTAYAVTPESVNETHGEWISNEWNYQEKITTDFNNQTRNCKKCVYQRKCAKTKWSLFRDRYCKTWESEGFGDPVHCTDIQF